VSILVGYIHPAENGAFAVLINEAKRDKREKKEKKRQQRALIRPSISS
jgi:hypothetical protein